MSAKMAAAIHVNGLERSLLLPLVRGHILAPESPAAPASLSVSSTHSSPNAQPPMTSLGQWTPSITRLVPISSDSRIAPAAAAPMPARTRGQRQRQRQVEDHRAGRMAAREGRGLHDHQMRLESGRARAIQYF